MTRFFNFFKKQTPNDSNLPTGSPIASSHSQIKNSPSPLIQHKRRSPQINRRSPLGNRVISERKSPEKNPDDPFNFGIITFTNEDQSANTKNEDQNQQEENIPNPQISPQSSELMPNQLSNTEDDSEDYFLGDYNLTPLREKSPLSRKSALGQPLSSISKTPRSPVFIHPKEPIAEIETIGYKPREFSVDLARVVKKSVVSSLQSLSVQQHTKIIAGNIITSFFQVFDEWCRQKEKQEKIEAEKRQEMDSLAPDYAKQQEFAKEKIKELKEEEQKWKHASNIEKTNLNQTLASTGNISFTDFSNFEGQNQSKLVTINADYDMDLTQELIVFLDKLQLKIQSEYALARQVDTEAEDLSFAMNKVSKNDENQDIDKLLGH